MNHRHDAWAVLSELSRRTRPMASTRTPSEGVIQAGRSHRIGGGTRAQTALLPALHQWFKEALVGEKQPRPRHPCRGSGARGTTGQQGFAG